MCEPTAGFAGSGLLFYMDKSKKELGKFIRAFSHDEGTFYVRGLTVAEYIDLIEQREGTMTEHMFVDIALTTIEGWEDVYVESSDFENESGSVQEYEYREGREESLPLALLTEIGKYSYKELTILSDEEDSKIRGFVNFLYWQSNDDNKGKVKYFDCETCLESGKAVSKPCGRFSMEERLSYRDGREKKSDKKNKVKSKSNSNSKNKYTSSKTYMSKEEAKQSSSVSEKNQLSLNGYKFPECPVSWIDNHLKMLCETLYHAEKSDRNFFDGGIADQPYKIYKASVIIKNEYNSIEKEEMDNDKSNTGSTNYKKR